MGSLKGYRMKNYALNVLDSGGDTSDATAAMSDILPGKTAYVASGKVSGSYDIDTNKFGDGTEDSYNGTLALSTNTYTGVCPEIIIKKSTWVSAIKVYIDTSDTNVTMNIRTGNTVTKIQKTGLSLIGGQYNTITLDTPIFMGQDAHYFIEFLFSAAQKLARTTSYAYDGTLWNLYRSRTNSYSGSTYTETIGLGLIEYSG